MLATWVWDCRRSDVWVLLGVSAIFGRLWTYHRVYDDAIPIVAVVALARCANRAPENGSDLLAQGLFTVFVLILWMPLQFHYKGSTLGPYTVSHTWNLVLNASHTAGALVVLLVLAAWGVVDARGQVAS